MRKYRSHVVFDCPLLPPLLAVVVFLLAGCTTVLAPLGERLGAVPAGGQSVGLSASPLQYYYWVQAATAEEIAAEQLRLDADPSAMDPVVRAVQLGLLLGTATGATPEAELEVIAMLDEIAEPGLWTALNREYAIFGQLLRRQLQEKQVLRSDVAAATTIRQELAAQVRLNRQLQNKIEALTGIEQTLIQREQERTTP